MAAFLLSCAAESELSEDTAALSNADNFKLRAMAHTIFQESQMWHEAHSKSLNGFDLSTRHLLEDRILRGLVHANAVFYGVKADPEANEMDLKGEPELDFTLQSSFTLEVDLRVADNNEGKKRTLRVELQDPVGPPALLQAASFHSVGEGVAPEMVGINVGCVQLARSRGFNRMTAPPLCADESYIIDHFSVDAPSNNTCSALQNAIAALEKNDQWRILGQNVVFDEEDDNPNPSLCDYCLMYNPNVPKQIGPNLPVYERAACEE